MSVHVIAIDLDEPDEIGHQEITDDYIVTVAGSCYVESVAMTPDGTHVVTIKGSSAAPVETPVKVTFDDQGKVLSREEGSS